MGYAPDRGRQREKERERERQGVRKVHRKSTSATMEEQERGRLAEVKESKRKERRRSETLAALEVSWFAI